MTDREIVAACAVDFRRKAQEAYDAYQSTGMMRYDNAYHKYEALADALDRDVQKADTRQAAASLKSELIMLASAASRAKRPPRRKVRCWRWRKRLSRPEGCTAMTGRRWTHEQRNNHCLSGGVPTEQGAVTAYICKKDVEDPRPSPCQHSWQDKSGVAVLRRPYLRCGQYRGAGRPVAVSQAPQTYRGRREPLRRDRSAVKATRRRKTK